MDRQQQDRVSAVDQSSQGGLRGPEPDKVAFTCEPCRHGPAGREAATALGRAQMGIFGLVAVRDGQGSRGPETGSDLP